MREQSGSMLHGHSYSKGLTTTVTILKTTVARMFESKVVSILMHHETEVTTIARVVKTNLIHPSIKQEIQKWNVSRIYSFLHLDVDVQFPSRSRRMPNKQYQDKRHLVRKR